MAALAVVQAVVAVNEGVCRGEQLPLRRSAEAGWGACAGAAAGGGGGQAVDEGFEGGGHCGRFGGLSCAEELEAVDVEDCRWWLRFMGALMS